MNQHNVTVLRRGEGRGSKGNEGGRGGEWRGEEVEREWRGGDWRGEEGREGDMGSGLGEWVGMRGRGGCDGRGSLDDPFSCISQ